MVDKTTFLQFNIVKSRAHIIAFNALDSIDLQTRLVLNLDICNNNEPKQIDEIQQRLKFRIWIQRWEKSTEFYARKIYIAPLEFCQCFSRYITWAMTFFQTHYRTLKNKHIHHLHWVLIHKDTKNDSQHKDIFKNKESNIGTDGTHSNKFLMNSRLKAFLSMASH